MSTPTPLRVLLLEDHATDAELVLAQLSRAGFAPAATRVQTEAELAEALDHEFDVILADYHLPQYDAERALRLVRARGIDVPFIVVSGTIGEERAAAIIKQGASDYLLKDRLARLGLAVRQALAQRRLRREKEHAETRFRAVVEHAADIIAIVDDQGRMRYASPALERVLGQDPRDSLDQPVLELVHPEDQVSAKDVFMAALAQPTAPQRGVFRLQHQDGTWRWIEAIATELLADGGPAAGVIINARDVTDRRRLETLEGLAAERAALLATERDYARKLEELATVRADFTAMVAHELNSRIAAIRRYADLMAIDALSPVQGDAVASIQSEVVSLQTLIGDARAAATVDRDDFAVLPRPVAIDTLLTEALTFARTLPGEHPVETDVAATGKVRADPARIGQVLRNLLSNAAKYSPPGSLITVRVRPRDDCARFEISDRGYGIERDDFSHIFEKYGRGSAEVVQHTAGVGLGLYLSRRITQAHGGDLVATSTPGRGSTFWFELEAVR
jgi:PAS domain S-box-containing protein